MRDGRRCLFLPKKGGCEVSPTLSICIPTYNRIHYLRDLVENLLPQIDSVVNGMVELLVSNNASTDGTDSYCRSIDRSYLRYWINETNIGGDRNFLKCIQESKGEYVWLVGDDDIIPAGAVAKTLEILLSNHLDLLISDIKDAVGFELYADYGEFLSRKCNRNGSAALRHTLISANIFRRQIFDLAFAEEYLYTQYAHMFGVVKNISGKVVVTSGLINVRLIRADFAKYPSCLCVKQAMYFNYLARRFGQPQFRRFAFFNACNLPIEYASRVKNWIVRQFTKRLV